MQIDTLTGIVIDISVQIHSKIGPGCFEKVYEEILYRELINHGLKVQRQVMLDIKYNEVTIEKAYKLDLLVENMLPVELKSVHPMPPVYIKQMRTQLALFGLKNGLLLNFYVDLMKNGIYRVFNNFGNEKL